MGFGREGGGERRSEGVPERERISGTVRSGAVMGPFAFSLGAPGAHPARSKKTAKSDGRFAPKSGWVPWELLRIGGQRQKRGFWKRVLDRSFASQILDRSRGPCKTPDLLGTIALSRIPPGGLVWGSPKTNPNKRHPTYKNVWFFADNAMTPEQSDPQQRKRTKD